MKGNALTFVSIATGRYIDYWFTQAKSIKDNYRGSSPIKIVLLTDQIALAEKWQKSNLNLRTEIISIPSYGWPEATLLRYKVISEISQDKIEGVAIYLDADMEFVREFTQLEFQPNPNLRMTFVEHPGYWREKGISAYLRNPNLILRDAFRKFRMGGLGAWETRKESLAYCERNQRKLYCCGGIWFGPKTEFLHFVQEMSIKVETDLKYGITAIWHDESHLNKWVSENPHNIKNPSYCYASEFKHLKGIKPLVRAVQKNL